MGTDECQGQPREPLVVWEISETMLKFLRAAQCGVAYWFAAEAHNLGDAGSIPVSATSP
jgi:hypothetical protein